MGSLLSLCCSQKSTPDWVARMFVRHWAAACRTSILTWRQNTEYSNYECKQLILPQLVMLTTLLALYLDTFIQSIHQSSLSQCILGRDVLIHLTAAEWVHHSCSWGGCKDTVTQWRWRASQPFHKGGLCRAAGRWWRNLQDQVLPDNSLRPLEGKMCVCTRKIVYKWRTAQTWLRTQHAELL